MPQIFYFILFMFISNQNQLYRVIQEESALLWEMIVLVILSKKVHTNMGPILNGYGVMTAVVCALPLLVRLTTERAA
jgi:hypothetical protein